MSPRALPLLWAATAAALAAAACGAPGTAGELGAVPMQSPRTGLVYSEEFLRHDTGPGHPERPERLTAIVGRLRRNGLMERLAVLPVEPAPLE